MFENITAEHGKALDEILRARHSVRAFKPTLPSREDVAQIIRAGLIAPFASLPAKGKTDFRKIIVIPSNSDTMKKMADIVNRGKSTFISETKGLPNIEPSVKKILEASEITRLLGNAPYLIVAAERKGFPPTYMTDQSISLSYCMYNMWLKAVSLKIGFRLLSIFIHEKLGNNEEFCKLVGLPCREFALDACAIGYPAETYKPPQVNYPDYNSNVKWY
ncbi:nitroreductase family protein [Candidatus Bathyarchaeota archaeon]|nr:nitroreductase family protein [Candidatus Bathyarchaeota archaeon]